MRTAAASSDGVHAEQWTREDADGRTERGQHGPVPPVGGDPADGLAFEVSVCDLVRWQDEQILEEHLYYDQHRILAQLGQVHART